MATTSFWDRYTSRRISRRRALQAAALTGAAAGAVAIVGCGGDDDDGDGTPSAGTTPGGNGDVVTGGTLRGTVSLVLGKDPHKAATFLTHALASYSYSRLMRFKTQEGTLAEDEFYTPVPEVASSVREPRPDRRTSSRFVQT